MRLLTSSSIQYLPHHLAKSGLHGAQKGDLHAEPVNSTEPGSSTCGAQEEGLLLTLFGWVCFAWTWAIAACQMFAFVVLLLPGFMQMVAFYIFSRRVAKGIPYGPGPRQNLDLYWPPGAAKVASGSGDDGARHPVVIFITGGAWMVGYKAWGAILARRLSQQGVLVASLDYRNYPQGSALQMVEDVNLGIKWVLQHIAEYAGDVSRITVVGQSAGAHLGALAMFRQAERVATGKPVLGASPAWNPLDLKAFVGVSGIYDLAALSEHLHRRGLSKRSLVEVVMTIDGRTALAELSPVEVARAWPRGTRSEVATAKAASGCASPRAHSPWALPLPPILSHIPMAGGALPLCAQLVMASLACLKAPGRSKRLLVLLATAARLASSRGSSRAEESFSLCRALLPDITLIHGTKDKSSPHVEQTCHLYQVLKEQNVPCSLHLLEGFGHTSLILEQPMKGGRDVLANLVLQVAAGHGEVLEHAQLNPKIFCDWAGRVCPF